MTDPRAEGHASQPTSQATDEPSPRPPMERPAVGLAPPLPPQPGAMVQAQPPTPDLAVATRGVVKRYGRQPALLGLDMSVPRGKVYGFLGPNGSGKTTTMRLLVGLIKPEEGSLWLFGEPFSWRDRRRLFRVGSLIETPAFYPYLSGRDNLRVIAAAGAPTPAHRVDEVLGYVGLTPRANSSVKTYSLGMKQRLGVAAALLSDPDLLILDEPANGLDPGGMVALRETLRWLTGLGKTVLVSSHLLSEVEQLADVVGIIDRGRLLREGPLDELMRATGEVRVRVRPDEMVRAAEVLRRLAPDRPLYGVDTGPRAGWFHVGFDPARAAEISRALAEAGVYVSGLEAGSDLESFFLQVTTQIGQPTAGRQGP
ncbi:MAG TPA: ABC transporter ATP-binding protein [Candidatus Limnocylindrales bacterium]|nr:ABC transporter ATP-binding protein [Candidatus Limnocylindrales bacterium]